MPKRVWRVKGTVTMNGVGSGRSFPACSDVECSESALSVARANG